MRAPKLIDLVAIAMTVGAIASVALLMRRQSVAARGGNGLEAVTFDGWEEVAATGYRSSIMATQVTITEFSDFQCPFCRRLQFAMDSISPDLLSGVTFVFRHFPLTMHPHAIAAAEAAHCAQEQGKFGPFKRVVFTAQDSIGMMTWWEFASRAGVPDSLRFHACLVDPSTREYVDRDIAVGKEIGVEGTPQVLVNEFMVPGAPTAAGLDSLIRRALDSRSSQ